MPEEIAPETAPKQGIMAFIKGHLKSIIIAGVIFVPIIFLVIFLTRPEQKEYITEEATRGDLTQVVEAVGTIASEKDIGLRFPITGLVEEIFVKEGDQVTKGMELARLRNTTLQADVQAASATLQQARAELAALVEGTRPEDLLIAEAEVENKRASLEAARETLVTAEENAKRSEQKLRQLEREVETGLEGRITKVRSTAPEQIVTARSALATTIDVFNNNDVEDVFSKDDPAGLSFVQSVTQDAQQELNDFITSEIKTDDYESAVEALEEARNLVAEVARAIRLSFDKLDARPTTSVFTNANKTDYKSTLSTQRTNVQAALTVLDNSLKDLRDARANYDTQIASEEASLASAQGTMNQARADIQTFETSLRIEEAQLELARAGTRKADIDAARARVTKASADLTRAQSQFDDSYLKAPIDGLITKVNLKEGEFTGGLDAASNAITMLGASPYYIEMYVAEIDIPKVRLSQSGSVELDAFPGTLFPLQVAEIDPAASDVDGVSKYLVKLDFLEFDEGFKIGMTGDAEIYTQSREGIIMVPSRAIVPDEDGDDAVRILKENGTVEMRKVKTGLEGTTDVEAVEGVEEGEIIIVLIK